jgi:hypothetical protein
MALARKMAMGPRGAAEAPQEAESDLPDEQYNDVMNRIAQATLLALKQPAIKQSIARAAQQQDAAGALGDLAFTTLAGLDDRSGATIPEEALPGAAIVVLGMMTELAQEAGVRADETFVARATQAMLTKFMREQGADENEINRTVGAIDPRAVAQAMRQRG